MAVPWFQRERGFLQCRGHHKNQNATKNVRDISVLIFFLARHCPWKEHIAQNIIMVGQHACALPRTSFWAYLLGVCCDTLSIGVVVCYMFYMRFKELYSRLFADLDNALSEQYDLLLHEEYGLEYDEEVVYYLASKLSDISSTMRAAKSTLPVHFLHLPPNQVTFSLLHRVEVRAVITRITLLRTLRAVTLVNRGYNSDLRVFELNMVANNLLEDMYQVLEELGSFLYFRNRSDTHHTSDLHLALESAVSAISHCITVLQSACSEKIALDLDIEVEERLSREAALEADKGLTENSIAKEEDRRKVAHEVPQRECINSSVVFSARRSTHVLACCVMLYALQSRGDIEAQHGVEKIHAITESLLTTSMLLAWHVPTKFRSMAAKVVAERSFAVKEQLFYITGLLATRNLQQLDGETAVCATKTSSHRCDFLMNSPSPMFKVLQSIVVHICDMLFDLAEAYEAHASNRPTSELPWNIRKPFKNYFVIFDLAEATFLTQHILHMMELNLYKNVGRMQYIAKTYGALDACTLMMSTVTIAAREAVNLVKKAESDFNSALSTLFHLGGEDFVEKFLCISRYSKAHSPLSRQDAHICARMYEIAQHVRNACYRLQSLKKYIFVLRLHDRPRPLQCINNVYLCCTRVFDMLLHEDYHDYAWNVSCRSTLPVLPGELPYKVDKYELLHSDDAPGAFFSSAMLEEALNPAILEKLKLYRDLEKQPPSTFLSSLFGAVQRVKDWLLHEEEPQPCPSSQLSATSISGLCQILHECIPRMPLIGRYVTDVCCSRVYEMECSGLFL